MPTVVEGDFEWDSGKAASNLATHGVSFSEAATVFADPVAVYLDDGSGTGVMVVAVSAKSTKAGDQRGASIEKAGRAGESGSTRARPGAPARRGVHLTLRTVREAAGKTQTEVGEAARIGQADISRLENRGTLDDCQVETLRRYVVALGGELELVAVFGDKKIILTGSSARDADPPPDKPVQRTAPRAGVRGSRR